MNMFSLINLKLHATEKELAAADNIVDRYRTSRQVTDEAYEEALKYVPEHPTEDDMIAEAVKRMKMLGFQPDMIENFKRDRSISCVMDDGQFVPLKKSDRKQIQKLKEYDYVVYAAIRSHTIKGKMTSYLVVSDQAENWIFEQNDLKYNMLNAYVYCHDMPFETEMGNIFVMKYSGNSLLRIL